MTDQPTPEIVEFPGATTMVVPARGLPPDGLMPFFDESFTALGSLASKQHVEVTGPAFARYYGPMGTAVDLEVGFPVAEAVPAEGTIEQGELPATTVARVVHPGAFDGLSSAWDALFSWVEDQGLRARPEDGLWEVYLTEPSPDMDPADLRTELNLPVTRD